ncbi:hypothetical protein CL644_00175 [bacterium]|nr:hypothetical protein [Parcubacteria group bacterium]MBF05115.1 hypothetical protein [bacterium]|tara:strand:- start:7522 stop:8139 length:618 start_codon:yes stop_codon:yes gene_type:complete
MKSRNHERQLVASTAIATLFETIATQPDWEAPGETLFAIASIAATTRFAKDATSPVDDGEVGHLLKMFETTAEHIGVLFISRIADVHGQLVAMSIGHHEDLMLLHESVMNFMEAINENSMLSGIHFRAALMVLDEFAIPTSDLEIVSDTCQTTAKLLGFTNKKWFRGTMTGLQHRIDAHAVGQKIESSTIQDDNQGSSDVSVAAD